MQTSVFHLADRSHIRLRGVDRVKFLHSFCTNDIKKLQPGQGCEAFLCNAKGRTIGHVTVFAEPEELWLETVPGAAAGLIAHLDRYIIREDVLLHDATAEFAEMACVGPQASEHLASALNVFEAARELPQLLERLSVPGSMGLTPLGDSAAVTVRLVDWLGQPTYLLFGPRPLIATLYQETVHAGGIAGADADWESWRIDAGFPTYGVDVTEQNLPQEAARNGRCLSFTKGCYLGQEPIARLDALGHTNRELRRLSLETHQPPAAGTPLLDAAADETVGAITSSAQSPSGAGCVALGYLKTRWTAPGTRVRVAENAETTAVVR